MFDSSPRVPESKRPLSSLSEAVTMADIKSFKRGTCVCLVCVCCGRAVRVCVCVCEFYVLCVWVLFLLADQKSRSTACTFSLQPCIARGNHCFALTLRARLTMRTAPARLLRYSTPDHGKCFVTTIRTRLTMVSTPALLLSTRTLDNGKRTRPTAAF